MLFRVRSHLPNVIERASGYDASKGIVPAGISSGARARDGFILEQRGLEFDRYRENPVVLYAHDDAGMFGDSRALPIARSADESFIEDRDMTTAVAHFDMEDEFARAVLGKIDRKLINATSIRWIPLEHRIDRIKRHEDSDQTEPVIVFVRSEVLEWSFVPIPADPNAIIQRADGGRMEFCADEACRLLSGDTKPPTRADTPADLDPLSLVDVVEAAHTLISRRSDAVFTAAELSAAARLYGSISARVFKSTALPARATDEIESVLDEFAGEFAGFRVELERKLITSKD